MQLDQKMLNRLLSMSDEQLASVIGKIAAESGIDPMLLGMNPENVQSIRQALGSAGEEELKQLGEIYTAYRQNQRH